jgi:hypothetical protein
LLICLNSSLFLHSLRPGGEWLPVFAPVIPFPVLLLTSQLPPSKADISLDSILHTKMS